MSAPFVGEIRLFAGNFPPDGWQFCDGQLMAIAQSEVLFDLIGTTYGGDGQTTFALPDMRGRVPVHQGNSGSGTTYVIGQAGGVENVTLTPGQMPQHTHAMSASTTAASAAHGPSEVLGSSTMSLYGSGTPNMAMDPNAIAQVGGGQPHANVPPFVALSYIISLFGIFPSQG